MPTRGQPPEWHITVLANRHCAHCAHATDLLADMALEMGIPLSGVDLWEHPEAATEKKLEGSPLIILEGPHGEEHVHVGLPREEELRSMLASVRDGAASGA